jgi:hypothetical protein
MTVREVQVLLPHPALPGADWADCFETLSAEGSLDAETAARQAFGRLPSWVAPLMALRNLVVRPFGLKHDPKAAIGGAPRIGMFPIISNSADQIVLGFDDRHLDFRIVVETHPQMGKTAIRLMTLIKRHNRLGRIYLAVITPFHKLIVAAALARVG